jgi:hydroxymethylbilane synthase
MTTNSQSKTIRLGTRSSLLARAQSQIVANELEHVHPGLSVELILCRTSGDRLIDRRLADAGGKGLFTKELEEALLRTEIDVAVHSFKDVPVTMPLIDTSALIVAAVPRRQDPRDVLVSSDAKRISQLPRGARVGTGSPRRRSQLLALRSDLQIQSLRGNIDTRLKKLAAGDYDAIVLASAGLRRSGLYDARLMTLIDVDDMVPAAGQGALALQCRRNDLRTREILGPLNHPDTALCVSVERMVVSALGGDCHSPIGAYASIIDGGRIIALRAAVGAHGGELPVITAESQAGVHDVAFVVEDVLELLQEDGRVIAQHVAVGA